MNRRFIPWCCLFLMLAGGLVAAPGCRKDTEEDKVRKSIQTMQKAAEDKNIKELLARISRKYQDPQGNNYEEIKGVILFYFFRHQKITVYLNNLDIKVDNGTAETVFEAVLSGRGTSGTVLPEAVGVYRFQVSFIKEPDAWKVLSARWERPGEGNGAEQ